MKNPSVAEYIVSALAQAGVQRVYGIVGDSLNEANIAAFIKVADAMLAYGVVKS